MDTCNMPSAIRQHSRAEANVVGLVLAAGASQRAGFPKALATLAGETFLTRTIRTLQAAGCSSVTAVIAAPHAARIRADPSLPPHTRLVENPVPRRGMSSSLQVALNSLGAHEATAIVMALVDHPRVAIWTIRQLIDHWSRLHIESTTDPHRHKPSVLRPRYRGRAGHPIVIDRSLFPLLRGAGAGADLRPLLRPRALDLDIDDPAVLDDLDEAADILSAGAHPPALPPVRARRLNSH